MKTLYKAAKNITIILALILIILWGIFAFSGGGVKFINGYKYVSAFQLDGNGGFLMKSLEGDRISIAVNTITLDYRYFDGYFVGVGIPAKIMTFTCNYGSSEGFSYLVENRIDLFYVDLNRDKEKHFSTFEDLYAELNNLKLDLVVFDKLKLIKSRKLLMSSMMVNKKLSKSCEFQNTNKTPNALIRHPP